MNKQEFDKNMEYIEEVTADEALEFTNECDFSNDYERLYLAYLMQYGSYEATGNLTLDQIFSMNSSDIHYTISDINCLQAWEMEEMNSYINKQKEVLSPDEYEELMGVCTGICISLGEHCDEVDGWFDDDNKDIDNVVNDFENSGLNDYFMDIKKERDIILDVDSLSFEELKENFEKELSAEDENILDDVSFERSK